MSAGRLTHRSVCDSFAKYNLCLEDMKVWKTKIFLILVLISFVAYIFLANIYKATWIGEEPWTKSNIILVCAAFFIALFFMILFELIKYLKRKGGSKKD